MSSPGVRYSFNAVSGYCGIAQGASKSECSSSTEISDTGIPFETPNDEEEIPGETPNDEEVIPGETHNGEEEILGEAPNDEEGVSDESDNPVTPSTKASTSGMKYDSNHAIVCDGPLPPWRIPAVDPRASHELLIEVCAAYKLGGDLFGNMGGWCNIYESPVRVNLRPGPDPRWRAHRPTRMWCLIHCKCKNGLDTERQTVTIDGIEYLKLHEYPNFLINLSGGGILVLNTMLGPGISGTRTSTLVAPQTSTPTPQDIGQAPIEEALLVDEGPTENAASGAVLDPQSPSPTNCPLRLRAICGGWMPWWEFPDGYNVGNYNSLTQLCVATPCGGLPGANVGGFCNGHPINPIPIFVKQAAATPLWEDERLRAYCGIQCWCLTAGMANDAKNRRRGDLVDVGNGEFIDTSGYFPIKINSKTGEARILGPMTIGKVPTDSAALGTQGSNAASLVRVTKKLCRRGCSSMAQCSSSALCICRAAWEPGLDPVYPRGQCTRAHRRTVTVGGKRSVNVEDVENIESVEDDSDYNCLCNTTYVSKACCYAADGMVWEDSKSPLRDLR